MRPGPSVLTVLALLLTRETRGESLEHEGTLAPIGSLAVVAEQPAGG